MSSFINLRLEASGSSNAPWAYSALLNGLIDLGRLDEAQAQLAGALAANRRLDVPTLGGQESLLAALRGRPRAASRLVGHARQAYAARSMQIAAVAGSLERAETIARGALGSTTVDELVAQGRLLSDDEAAALALGAGDD